jgi:molybdenum cofactor synthesis domain-containing protein
MPMNTQIEIICVGNELLIGKTLNTNAQWLGKRATSLGMQVKRINVVGDNVDEIASTTQESLQRKPRFIIITGGLGPTFDDKTLEGIAESLHRKLETSEKALKMVRRKYETYAAENKTKKIELTPPRVKMATLPEKSEPLTNPVGTAPGVQITVGETDLIVLPGVPEEMEAIFQDSVAPVIRKETGRKVFLEKSIYTDGIMESALAPLVDQTMHRNPSVYIKSHPKGREKTPHLELHFSTSAKDSATAKTCIKKAVTQLSQLIVTSGGRIRKTESTQQL